MKFNQEPLERTEMQFAPMIDIVFLLLIFFIVTWSYARFETEIDISVPAAAEGVGLGIRCISFKDERAC